MNFTYKITDPLTGVQSGRRQGSLGSSPCRPTWAAVGTAPPSDRRSLLPWPLTTLPLHHGFPGNPVLKDPHLLCTSTAFFSPFTHLSKLPNITNFHVFIPYLPTHHISFLRTRAVPLYFSSSLGLKHYSANTPLIDEINSPAVHGPALPSPLHETSVCQTQRENSSITHETDSMKQLSSHCVLDPGPATQ